MAESVDALLAEQLEELQELQRRGIFSETEIRFIVKSRRGFEMALRKRQKLKEDYLQYIQYELNLEALRRKRKRALNIKERTQHSEYAIIQRLHFIFHRALQKFKGDIRLWLQYFDFCERTHARKILGKGFATALQYHSFNADLWVKAAKWEWEANANINAARILFQRGLRLNPTSPILWHEYFRLELLSLDKTVKRQKILGIYDPESRLAELPDSAAAAGGDGNGNNNDDDDEPQVYDEDAGDAESDEDVGEGSYAELKKLVDVPALPAEDSQPALELPKDKDMFLAGLIPQLVVSQAAVSIPDNVAFMEGFLRIYRLFEGTDASRDLLYNSLPDTTDALVLRCRRPLDDHPADAVMSAPQRVALVLQSHALFVQACAAHPGDAPLRTAHIRFLQSALEHVSPGTPEEERLAGMLLAGCEQAVAAGAATEAVFLAWLDELAAQGQAAAELARALEAVAACPASVALWQRALTLTATQGAAAVPALLTRARSHVVDRDARAAVWRWAVEYAMLHGDAAAVHEAFTGACVESPAVWVQYVDWAVAACGLPAARAVYTRLAGAAPPTEEFFLHCLALERSQAQIEAVHVRRLFEKAVAAYGATSSALWCAFFKFEQTVGDLQKANLVYWRGVKTLQSPETFITSVSLLR